MFNTRYDLPRVGVLPVAAGRTNPLARAAVHLGGAVAIAIALAAAAPAGELPRHGTIQGTDAALTHFADGVAAFTYWLNGPSGEVITLVRASNRSVDAGAKERDFVVRVSTMLAPGQTQTIAVPGIDWANPPTIRIRRVGETIEVTSSNADQEARNLSRSGPVSQ